MNRIKRAAYAILGKEDPDRPYRPHTVKVEPGVNGNYHWVERAPNGEITCSAEVSDAPTRPQSKANAERAARDHVAAVRVFVDGDA